MMVGDIKANFSLWINHKRNDKGKRPENIHNRRDLGGGRKKLTNFRGQYFKKIQFNIWWE